MKLKLNHDFLINNVKKLPEDYEPFGQIKKWENPNIDYPDCSGGCKYFIPLQGDLGRDWGVCLNKSSHRYGLLTFEHQGCLKFKFDKNKNVE